MSDTFVKVCGITTEEQLEWAIELGYDAIGLMTVPTSPRYVEPGTAESLIAQARGRIKTFAVGLTLDQVKPIIDLVDVVQLYEPAAVSPLALATHTKPESLNGVDYWFYDASHGSGVFEDIPDWVSEVPTNVVIAGGLNPNNVGQIITEYQPYGVDVSSGVEKQRGVKDYQLMSDFIHAVHHPN